LDKHFDLGVIGGGIVGLATAYKFQLKYPKKNIAVFEKEEQVAAHQTGRNSGVIHSGIYYKPGSYKALNCVDGRKQLVNFAQDHGIPHDVCGKIILATQESELPILDGIYKRGVENKIEGISMIGPDEIKQLEPHARGISAIHVPVTGIIDFKAVCYKLVELIQRINPDSKIFYNTEVTGIFDEAEQSGIETSKGRFKLSQKVFCAGLQADRMARLESIDLEMRIVGFRGDYYELSETGKYKVRNLIYPVPDPNFPFLGVHFTRMTDGSVECGPNAVFSFKREGYSRTAFDLKDSMDALSFSGTWKLFFKHPKKGLDEYRRAFSKKLFLKELQKMIPDLEDSDIVEGRSGVRAQAIKKDGSLVDDFHLRFGRNSVHVINAPSPAATACLSIADYIVQRIEDQQSTN
jgi:L-2-hydroxyglutarate oxidase